MMGAGSRSFPPFLARTVLRADAVRGVAEQSPRDEIAEARSLAQLARRAQDRRAGCHKKA